MSKLKQLTATQWLTGIVALLAISALVAQVFIRIISL